MKLLTCDNCTHEEEVMYRLVSLNPTGLRLICENCFDKKPRFYTLHILCTQYAWQ